MVADRIDAESYGLGIAFVESAPDGRTDEFCVPAVGRQSGDAGSLCGEPAGDNSTVDFRRPFARGNLASAQGAGAFGVAG